MRDIRRRIAIAVIAAGMALGIGSGAAAASSGTAVVTPPDLIEVLGGKQGRLDVVPDDIPFDLLSGGVIARESTRFLGRDGSAGYWVAVDRFGGVCLVVVFPVTGFGASACVPAKDLSTHGISLLLTDAVHDESRQVVLVPDGVSFDDLPHGWDHLSANLLVGAKDAHGGSFELSRPGSASITMYPVLSAE